MQTPREKSSQDENLSKPSKQRNDASIFIQSGPTRGSVGALEGNSIETAPSLMMPQSHLSSINTDVRLLPRSFIWNHNVSKLFVDETAIERKPPDLSELKRLCRE